MPLNRQAAVLLRGFAAIALSTCAITGCFALFSLEEYGPGNPDAEPIVEPDPPVPPDPPPAPTSNRPAGQMIFVTSADWAIEADGLLGMPNAHHICRQAAQQAQLPNAGRFFAWLSDNLKNPQNSWPLYDAGPVALVDPLDRVVVGSLAELADSGPRVPINVTESGSELPIPDGGLCDVGGAVWSGTTPSGTRDPANMNADCQQWTASADTARGNSGLLGQKGSAWTTGCALPCNKRARIYCVEQ